MLFYYNRNYKSLQLEILSKWFASFYFQLNYNLNTAFRYLTSKTLTDCNTKRADKVKNMRNDVMLLLLFLLFFLSFGIPGDRPLKSFISLLLVFLLHFELFESTPGLSLVIHSFPPFFSHSLSRLLIIQLKYTHKVIERRINLKFIICKANKILGKVSHNDKATPTTVEWIVWGCTNTYFQSKAQLLDRPSQL